MKNLNDLYQQISRTGQDLNWHAYAACADYINVSDVWFAESTRGKDDQIQAATYTKHAQLICSSCPVIEECGEYAIRTREPYGVWGGLTVDQRKTLWKGRRA
jgi:WhiB family redox-sensing transcriptional regulator